MNKNNRRPWKLGELARLLEGVPVGDQDTEITGVAGIDEAQPGDLVFAESAALLAAACAGKAAAVLASERPEASEKPLILVKSPRIAFVRFLEALAPRPEIARGVHPSAIIAETAVVGADVRIGPNVVVADDVSLGDGVQIFPGVHIGAGCEVGAGTVLMPNVVLYPGVRIGRNCLVHGGCVLGSDGFGFLPVGGALMKVPHLGGVEIGDDVEIGANTCIDRSKTGMTSIGSGTKIDNLVHIAHNVQVGASCLLAGQIGIAGSSTLGAGVMLGGQVGVKDHVHLGAGVQVGAQSGIMRDVPAGEVVFGSPAVPMRQKLREMASATRLPDALKTVSQLERRIAALERRLATDGAAGEGPN